MKSYWKDIHQNMYTVYHLLIAGSLVPFALLFLDYDTSKKDAAEINQEGFSILSLLIIPFIYGCWSLWRSSYFTFKITPEHLLKEKIEHFKKRMFRKFYLLGILGGLCCVVLWVSPSFLFVIAYFAVLIQFSFLRPSEKSLVETMRLSKAEVQELWKEESPQ